MRRPLRPHSNQASPPPEKLQKQKDSFKRVFSKVGMKTLNALYIKKLLRPQETKDQRPPSSNHGHILARLKILEQNKGLTQTLRKQMIRSSPASSIMRGGATGRRKQSRGKSVDFTSRPEKYISVQSPAKSVRRIYGHFESAPLSCNTTRSYSPTKGKKGEETEEYFKTNEGLERVSTNRDIRHILEEDNTLIFTNETHLAPKM